MCWWSSLKENMECKQIQFSFLAKSLQAMYFHFKMILLEIPVWTILTWECCVVREWFILTSINWSLGWQCAVMKRVVEREWWMGYWQVSTAKCVENLHECLHLFLHLSAMWFLTSLTSSSTFICLLMYIFRSVFSISSTVAFAFLIDHVNTEELCESAVCICKHMLVISYRLWLIIPRADFQIEALGSGQSSAKGAWWDAVICVHGAPSPPISTSTNEKDLSPVLSTPSESCGWKLVEGHSSTWPP